MFNENIYFNNKNAYIKTILFQMWTRWGTTVKHFMRVGCGFWRRKIIYWFIYICMKSVHVKYWLPSFCSSKAASYSWGDVLNKFQHKKVSAYSDEIEGTKWTMSEQSRNPWWFKSCYWNVCWNSWTVPQNHDKVEEVENHEKAESLKLKMLENFKLPLLKTPVMIHQLKIFIKFK